MHLDNCFALFARIKNSYINMYIANSDISAFSFAGEIHWLQRPAARRTSSTFPKWLSGGPHGDCVRSDGHQPPARFRQCVRELSCRSQRLRFRQGTRQGKWTPLFTHALSQLSWSLSRPYPDEPRTDFQSFALAIKT